MSAPDIAAMSDEQLAIALTVARLDAPAARVEKDWRMYSSDLHRGALRLARYVRTLIPPAAQPVARVTIGLQMDADGNPVILCNDGAMFREGAHGEWFPLKPIPQPAAPRFALQPALYSLTPDQQEAQDRDRVEAAMADNQEAAEREMHDHDPVAAAAPELLDAARDALAGWHYIRDHHGDLPGVGWGRVDSALTLAIARAEGRT